MQAKLVAIYLLSKFLAQRLKETDPLKVNDPKGTVRQNLAVIFRLNLQYLHDIIFTYKILSINSLIGIEKVKITKKELVVAIKEDIYLTHLILNQPQKNKIEILAHLVSMCDQYELETHIYKLRVDKENKKALLFIDIDQ